MATPVTPCHGAKPEIRRLRNFDEGFRPSAQQPRVLCGSTGIARGSLMRTAEPASSTTRQAQAPLAGYRLVLSHRVGQQLRQAPPVLQGHLTGIMAILRIDPTAASTMLHIQPSCGDHWTATYQDGRGFLQYRVIQPQRLVVVLDWVWID